MVRPWWASVLAVFDVNVITLVGASSKLSREEVVARVRIDEVSDLLDVEADLDGQNPKFERLLVLNIPEHRLGLPELVLQLVHELGPYEYVEKHDVENVDYEYRPVLHVLSVKATQSKTSDDVALQVVDVGFKLVHEHCEGLAEVVVLHALG